jgi:hypothetical protein
VVIYKYEYSLLQLSTNSADITYYIRGGINNEIKALHTLDCCGFYDLVIDGHIFCRNFPDITSRHSWAEEYIENMVQRGLLKGYTDGTFKPDNPISKLEAIILASRILGVTYEENEEFADAALAAFEDDLDKYDIQYKKEAAYLLYRGVLKISELRSI